MKKLLSILRIQLLILTVIFGFCVSSCELSKTVTVNASTGEITFNEKTNYVPKGETVNIEVTNYNPIRDSIVFKKSDYDVQIDGDQAKNLLKELQEKAESTKASVVPKIATLGIEQNSKEDNDLSKLTLLKADYDYYISQFLRRAQTIKTQDELTQLIDDIHSADESLLSDFNSLHTINDSSLADVIEIIKTQRRQFLEMQQLVNSLTMKTIFTFQPKKEVTEIKVEMYRRNTKKTLQSIELEFITQNRFKLSSSVGAHVLIVHSSYTKEFKNVDSLITERTISNIQPSFGTYLNGTWRVNDALMGIGLGVGIPFDGKDLTPNFSFFSTALFQTGSGRLGVNLGIGIRKVDMLAPGYERGSNLGGASIDVPTISTWRPGLMFGLSYVIGTNKE